MTARMRWPAWDIALSAIALLGVLFTWLRGQSNGIMVVALVAYVPVAIALRVIATVRRRMSLAFLRRPFARDHRGFLIQGVVMWAALMILTLVVRVSMIPEQLGGDHEEVLEILDTLVIAAALLALLPRAAPRAPTTILMGTLALFFGIQLLMLHNEADAGDGVVLELPMGSEALVIQGGPSPLVNHHYLVGSQRHALDLVVLRDGAIQRGDDADLASYACFGTPILAPAEGRVTHASDDLPDNPIGSTDRDHRAGNHVIIDIGGGHHVLLAHLRQRSVSVARGDVVRTGQAIGACGNSGNSSEPHLHLQVQDRAEFSDDATTVPILFQSAVRIRDGATVQRPTVPARRSDHLRPVAAPAPR